MPPKKKAATTSENDAIMMKYKKLDHREHVLSRPGMYVGSIEEDTYNTWVFDEDANKMVKKDIRIVPALYKIFDEILVNAMDHHVRLKTNGAGPGVNLVKNIKVTIDKQSGLVSVFNDGDGIEIIEHEEHKIYIPELIFGHLLTSANYDDTEEKIIGGQNGIGAKACNIFSTRFTLETVDATRKKIYQQEFSNNMSEKTKPVIKACAKKPYTFITFMPDYSRFKMAQGLSEDMYQLFVKRTLDMCALTGQEVNIWLNGKKLEYKNFEKYVDLYLGPKAEYPRVHEVINDRWEIVVSHTEQVGFDQVSFVNGIWTIKGGKHVDYVSNQISSKLADFINKKKKNDSIKPQHVKNYLMVFIKSTINNPGFDSQSKDYLTTAYTKFGSKADISDKFIEKLFKTPLADKAMSLCEVQDNKTMQKTDGKKRNVLRGIIKLDDASLAGTARSKECTLILTEGDSAKSMALSGLQVVGREKYGVFPLKGKLLNVKDIAVKKLSENEEITNLKKILGLESNRDYKSLDDLRYGRIMLMTDADVDGSHIKGLIFNMFQTLWPSLFAANGFLTSMLTPIVKARNNSTKEVIKFYNLTDYEHWKTEAPRTNWEIKYYKGLGTSNNDEAKEYFRELKIVDYQYTPEGSDNSIDLAFNKKRADDRKEWLSHYNRNNVLAFDAKQVSYEDFVNKDLIHFSNYDIERSIPNVCDGFKVSQRKIMFGCFKKNLVKEIRVAQLSGYISENACYHHGEVSLQNAIISLAQDFVGSNNINLLKPNGQFGTRVQGGKNASSPRYIHTEIDELAFAIFRKEDQHVLNYLDDDGIVVEPEYYIPIIPMVLINGALGIGTGFSTSIPCYNPKDIIGMIRTKLSGDVELYNNGKEVHPWYRGYRGVIEKVGEGKYVSRAIFSKLNATTIQITELPIGTWTEDFKATLEDMIDKKSEVKNYEIVDAINIKINVIFGTAADTDAYMALADNGYTRFENEFKLVSNKTLGTTNMYLFNRNGQITKYNNVQEVVDEYYKVRLEFYDKRKQYLLAAWKKQLAVMENKARFIREVIDGILIIQRRLKADVVAELGLNNYMEHDGGYDYLLGLTMMHMTEDKIEDLEKSIQGMNQKIEDLDATTLEKIWLRELDELEALYDEKYKAFIDNTQGCTVVEKALVSKGGRGRRKVVV